jgi:hypothetical protein
MNMQLDHYKNVPMNFDKSGGQETEAMRRKASQS